MSQETSEPKTEQAVSEVSPSDPAHKEQSRVERGDSPFTFGQRVLQSDDDVWNHNAW